MGTKTNPGKFDCYANAKPDEPLFVLLARDRHAAEVVRYWLALKMGFPPVGYVSEPLPEIVEKMPEKYREALSCADAMDQYRKENP